METLDSDMTDEIFDDPFEENLLDTEEQYFEPDTLPPIPQPDEEVYSEDQQEIILPESKSWSDRLHGLNFKLIIPYVILTLITAMVGIFIVTRLVTSSFRERFANQMLEASRVAGDGIVRREKTHLETLRLMSFTQGVSEALLDNNEEILQGLLFPLVINENVHSLTAVNILGQEILSLVYDPTSGQYAISRGADLSNLDLVVKPLVGQADEIGDKYAGVVQTIYGPYLITSSPVPSEDSGRAGVLLIGSQLETLGAELKAQALADIIFLDSLGGVVSTTLPQPEEGYEILGLNPIQIENLEPALSRDLELYNRRYEAYYAPLIVRQETVGVLGIVLPSTFLVTTESTSRNLFSLIFTLGTVAIIIAGYFLSQSIAKPILRMRDVSLAVASGDLDQTTGLQRKDEIGQLAAVFDLMTFRLRKRTAQAVRLYEETVQRNRDLADANMRLQQAQQQLIQSEKLASVGELTAGIVHDVKNPLAVIKGLSEEIREDVGGDSPFVEQLNLIRDNATRANTIVTDLLKFARQSNPEMKYQNICDTVNSSLRLTDYLARKNKVIIETEMDPPTIMTSFDAQQMEQVLINLYQNSIQAMPDGGMLEVEVNQDDRWVNIKISDTGVGIAPENLKRIFDPFFTTKPEGEGTGLGLSVSYGIVSMHRGTIDVESAVGEGSTFTIRLPRSGVDGGDNGQFDS